MTETQQDRLLILSEVSELTRIPETSLRWLRHVGRAPWLWKSGRKIVAWESDVRKFLDEQRAVTSK